MEDRNLDLGRKDYKPALSHRPKPLKQLEYLRQQGCGRCIVAVRLCDEESNYRKQLCRICYVMLVPSPFSANCQTTKRDNEHDDLHTDSDVF